MISKEDVLKLQDKKKDKELKQYIKLVDKAIKKKYPQGLEFYECPYVEILLSYDDIDIKYYTNIEKELIKAIQLSKAFKTIANELINNGYKYEFSDQVEFLHSKPEWVINLIIK